KAPIGERPPRFAIQVNSRTRVTRDYAYFLENRLRARYGMDGVPLIIDFVERGQRGQRGQSVRARAAQTSASCQPRPQRVRPHGADHESMPQLSENEFLFTSESG